jgi:aldehyde:ferredoxin oxidoreductase
MEEVEMATTEKQTTPINDQIYGYNGKLLRVDLSKQKTTIDKLEEPFLRKYLGGAAMGIKYMYDEVPAGVEWQSPENRLFFGAGPLSGTRVGGSGCIAAVTKGAMTNGIASTQANGFFGAFLRFSGFDGIILQGAATSLVYLHIHDGKAEIKDASHLAGKNTYETESIIKADLNKKEREASVLCIGPAGEHLVRFACVYTDLGHIAAHNGVGAVMGSKKLKAIVVERGATSTIPMKDKEGLTNIAKEILANTLNDKFLNMVNHDGTVGGVYDSVPRGVVPVRNYESNIYVIEPAKLDAYKSQNVRDKFKAKPSPCWACQSRHTHMMEITDGEFAGRKTEEPEYEDMATFSSLVGIDDVTKTLVLSSEVDRLGMDVNETGWILAFVMECYEKHLISKKETEGLDMTWGNDKAIMTLMTKIANREGFGDLLAEGVMRASQKLGGQMPKLAINAQKGNTPRSHDHRMMWFEMFDTCVSNMGTLETRSRAPLKLLGLPETFDPFDPIAVSTTVAKTKGVMVFEDSLVTCHFQTAAAVPLLCQAINAATGWDMNFEEAVAIGRRAVNMARMFNIKHGISPELDRPSVRYGSTPLDGALAGRGILQHWDKMLQNYYNLMGWDTTGIPLPETLKSLGI